MLRKNRKSQSTKGLQEFEQIDFSGGMNTGINTKLDPTMLNDNEKLDSLNIFLDNNMTQSVRSGIAPAYPSIGLREGGVGTTQIEIDEFNNNGVGQYSGGTGEGDVTNAFFTYPGASGLEVYQGFNGRLYKFNDSGTIWEEVLCTFSEYDVNPADPDGDLIPTERNDIPIEFAEDIFYKEAFLNGFITLPTGLGVYLYNGETWKKLGDLGLIDPDDNINFLREPTLIPGDDIKLALGYNTFHPDGVNAWRDFDVNEPTLQNLLVVGNKTNQVKPNEEIHLRLNWGDVPGALDKTIRYDIQYFTYTTELPSDPENIQFKSLYSGVAGLTDTGLPTTYSTIPVSNYSYQNSFSNAGVIYNSPVRIDVDLTTRNDLLTPYVAAGYTGRQSVDFYASYGVIPCRQNNVADEDYNAFGLNCTYSDAVGGTLDGPIISDSGWIEDYKDGTSIADRVYISSPMLNRAETLIDVKFTLPNPSKVYIRAVLYEVTGNGFDGEGYIDMSTTDNGYNDSIWYGRPFTTFTVLDTLEIPDFEVTTNPEIPNDLLTPDIMSQVRNALAYKNRFYLCNNEEAPQIINISDITNYDYYPYFYHAVPQIDSGESINFLFQRPVSLLLSTDRETRNLVGSEPISLTTDTSQVFDNKLQYPTVGSNAFRTYKYTTDQILGLTTEGVKVMKTKTFATDDIDKGTNVDTPISSLIPASATDTCFAEIIDQRYWLFKPDGEALVYDMFYSSDKPSWGRFQTRLPKIVATTSVGGSIYMLLQEGSIVKYGVGSSDWGLPIDINWVTKGFTGSQDTKDLHKSFQHVVLETSYVNNDANEIKAQVGVDSKHITEDTTKVTANNGVFDLEFNYENSADISDLLNSSVNTLGTWELGSDRFDDTHFGEETLETRLNISSSRKISSNGRYLSVRLFGSVTQPFTIRRITIGAKVFQSKFTKRKRRKDYGW